MLYIFNAFSGFCNKLRFFFFVSLNKILYILLKFQMGLGYKVPTKIYGYGSILL